MPLRASLALGQEGEAAALRHLRRRGCVIIGTRVKRLRGEIDIIARDGRTLVFVEVKTRKGGGFGRPEESVTPAKQKQIRRVAECYLAGRRLGHVPCRFDVIAVLCDGAGGRVIEHIEDAF
jgi:putative endonuclease